MKIERIRQKQLLVAAGLFAIFAAGRLFVIIAALPSFVGFGCNGVQSNSPISYADTLYHPRYATGFDIFAIGNNSVISLYNPWPGAVDRRYNIFLSRNGALPPSDFEGITVKLPLKRVICMSSSHRAFIDELGRLDAVKGISGTQYVFSDKVNAMVAAGDVVDVGYDGAVNYELITGIDPDMVFLYGISSESPVSIKLRQMNINTVHIGEFKEISPLGKAEWLVMFGELFDLRIGASREFRTIEHHYNELAQRAGETSTRPLVMLNAPWRDTWYIPGDESYMVRLLKDAGAEYVATGQDRRFSLPVSLESAWVMADRADFWLNPNGINTMAELSALNPKFKDIPSVIHSRVYNNNKRNNAHGGSDFWESGTVRPDMILKDLITIFHPEVLPESRELYYFHKLD